MLKCFEFTKNHDWVPICEAFPLFSSAARMFLGHWVSPQLWLDAPATSAQRPSGHQVSSSNSSGSNCPECHCHISPPTRYLPGTFRCWDTEITKKNMQNNSISLVSDDFRGRRTVKTCKSSMTLSENRVPFDPARLIISFDGFLDGTIAIFRWNCHPHFPRCKTTTSYLCHSWLNYH